jgi:hypothetical protein
MIAAQSKNYIINIHPSRYYFINNIVITYLMQSIAK